MGGWGGGGGFAQNVQNYIVASKVKYFISGWLLQVF